MRVIRADNYIPINLGRSGENRATTVIFPVDPDFYDADIKVLYQRENDMYPFLVSTDRATDVVRWIVTANETACPGPGSLEVVYIKDGVIAKTKIYKTIVEDSLEDSDDPIPEAKELWETAILEKIHDCDEAIRALNAEIERANELLINDAEAKQKIDTLQAAVNTIRAGIDESFEQITTRFTDYERNIQRITDLESTIAPRGWQSASIILEEPVAVIQINIPKTSMDIMYEIDFKDDDNVNRAGVSYLRCSVTPNSAAGSRIFELVVPTNNHGVKIQGRLGLGNEIAYAHNMRSVFSNGYDNAEMRTTEYLMPTSEYNVPRLFDGQLIFTFSGYNFGSGTKVKVNYR